VGDSNVAVCPPTIYPVQPLLVQRVNAEWGIIELDTLTACQGPVPPFDLT